MTQASRDIAIRIVAAAAVCCLAAITPAGTPERLEYMRIRMGVPFRITVYADDAAAANSAADTAFRRVQVLNGVFSDYDARSDARRLTQAAKPGVPQPVGNDMRILLDRSLTFSRQTDGAFDVTVGSVTKLWRKARRAKQLPSDDELHRAVSLVGYRQLSLDTKASTVSFAQPGIELDFGAIARGYACDEILRIFREHGLTRVLVESSGDIVAGDPPPGKEHWTIGVGSLAKPDAPPEQFIALVNRAVTTSGDAYQFIEIDGVRYSHIVDPQTGLGLTTRSSATVIAPDCTTADALATAATVLGPEKGARLIEAIEGVELLMVCAGEDGILQEVTTPGFEQYIVETP